MATSSRQTNIFGVNDWKAIYKTFSQADFKSYDYESLRKSFVDYLRLYYPETFNDYTESSEYIALLDVIAFMGQALAFRNDLNTRENFIDTAERRDSVIKLANLVNYNPKRNICSQGFLKVASISTTENIRDSNGLNLNNATVIWNDPANPYWREQFNTIINASLLDSQKVGRPGNSQTILGIRTDEYSINLPAGSTPTLSFGAKVNGMGMSFEGVSVTSLNENYLYEIPPGPSNYFNVLYKNDNLGYGSPNTGFFMYFKQGSLQTYDFFIQQQISNQTVDINIEGINDSDTWLYQYDSTTNTYKQWTQVENVYANANLSEQANSRQIFSVKSRTNDQVTYTFGDGVFSEIPVGTFRALVRSSVGTQYTINPIEMQGTTVTVKYVSRVNRIETLTLNLELPLPVANSKTRESISDIKERAPTRYYSQNRMVNGEDYNTFPFTLYNSIIKTKALNRTSVGSSRSFDLNDPTGKYSSVNSFGDDGGLYQKTDNTTDVFSFNDDNEILGYLTENLKNILSGHRTQQYYVQNYPNFGNLPNIKWTKCAYNNINANGYFSSDGNPAIIGKYTATDLKYISPSAWVRFDAPSGKYFDENNQLVDGAPDPSRKTSIWTVVLEVIGDGNGPLLSGAGPITLAGEVPSGCGVGTIIPAFENTLSNTLLSQIVTSMTLNQDFVLKYTNIAVSEKWTLGKITDEDWFIRFKISGQNRYVITYKSLSYYFGSVRDTRFTYDSSKTVYDSYTGKVERDSITVLKANSKPNNATPLGNNVMLDVVGQVVESDGYPDDYAVEVSTSDLNYKGLLREPFFFGEVTGYVNQTTNLNYYTFFVNTQDPNLLSRSSMIPSNSVIFTYGSLTNIEVAKYAYPVGQIFYAFLENKFYKSIKDPVYELSLNIEPTNDYTALTGRQGLFFQYKHISNNASRVDPGTTNIIDLYVVTQSYYTQYMNWIRDVTGTITEPTVPNISELTLEYNKVDDYKMISDSVVLNSVRFKPLFGQKAEPQLRATIKVVKSSGVTVSDGEIRSRVLNSINAYFSIDNWDFGDTFYFSELSAYLHSKIGDLINSVVLVPNNSNLKFGDLYEIRSAPYEIFVNGAQATDIVVISALTAAELTIG